MNFPILSTLIFLPLISSFFIFLSKESKNNNSAIYISLFSSLATFLLSLFTIKIPSKSSSITSSSICANGAQQFFAWNFIWKRQFSVDLIIGVEAEFFLMPHRVLMQLLVCGNSSLTPFYDHCSNSLNIHASMLLCGT